MCKQHTVSTCGEPLVHVVLRLCHKVHDLGVVPDLEAHAHTNTHTHTRAHTHTHIHIHTEGSVNGCPVDFSKEGH